MSSFNVSKLRQKLINFQTGVAPDDSINFINDAITLCNMFESIDEGCRYYDIGEVTKLQLNRIIEHAKEMYFPAHEAKTIMVKAKGTTRRIQCVVDTIECIKGVEEVKTEE